MEEVTFEHLDGPAAYRIRDLVGEIDQDARAEKIEAGEAFDQLDAFLDRFDAYVQRPGFDLVLARLDGQPVGQAWGWPLDADTGWWRGLTDEPEPGFTQEDGHRTFAFSELMVRRSAAGQGLGHAIHDELLAHRPETRATLLVRPENTVAYQAYERWGWRKVAELRPAVPHAPHMHVLILPLPTT
ncbi:GNAT family N-acetyltransferase [Spirillospora sp. NPDC047279]|uniref:GNAT family N-acetyltransferase n=1 Tax=Spirillospora sp. NPDC047279 TaxID=3155478 RepID=UPI0033E62E65